MGRSNMTPQPQPNPTLTAVHHFHLYGQPGSASTCLEPSSPPLPDRPKATAAAWRNIKPLSRPVTSPWGLHITPAAIATLTHGFIPREMEDKWFVYAEGPDDAGVLRVRFFRSWTGFEIAVLVIRGPVVEEIVWESDEERIRMANERGAKRMVREVCRWVLEVEIGGEEEAEESSEEEEGGREGEGNHGEEQGEGGGGGGGRRRGRGRGGGGEKGKQMEVSLAVAVHDAVVPTPRPDPPQRRTTASRPPPR